MPKLRHVSLHTADPDTTAEFYKRVFDMVEVGRADDEFAEGIFLSDGTINLSVIRFKTEQAADRGDDLAPVFGLHHFGFFVEDEDETRRKLKDAGAKYLFTVDQPDFFEEKYRGPDSVMIDISGRGWVGAKSS
jgi:catechol 2,3-dioxygenase-like lactoylglutathione lyase family enzyme